FSKLEFSLTIQKSSRQRDRDDRPQKDERHLLGERQRRFHQIHGPENEIYGDPQRGGDNQIGKVAQSEIHWRSSSSQSDSSQASGFSQLCFWPACRRKTGVGPLPKGLKPAFRHRSKIVSSHRVRSSSSAMGCPVFIDRVMCQ